MSLRIATYLCLSALGILGVTTASAEDGVRQPDAAILLAHKSQIVEAMRRFKRYPIPAINEAAQGKAVVRLVYSSEGFVRAELRASSGHPMLDAEALDMATKAANAVEIPPELKGQAFEHWIPVVFELVP